MCLFVLPIQNLTLAAGILLIFYSQRGMLAMSDLGVCNLWANKGACRVLTEGCGHIPLCVSWSPMSPRRYTLVEPPTTLDASGVWCVARRWRRSPLPLMMCNTFTARGTTICEFEELGVGLLSDGRGMVERVVKRWWVWPSLGGRCLSHHGGGGPVALSVNVRLTPKPPLLLPLTM